MNDEGQTVDVIVVGTGAAGFTAALAAREQGASVMMLEKAPEVGGTTRKAGVWIWIPNNACMRAKGMDDPRDDALRYMARVSRPHVYDPASPTLGLADGELALLETFYDEAQAAVDLLGRQGALQPVHRDDIPDYYAELAEDAAPYGRVIMPQPDSRPRGGTGKEFVASLERAAKSAGIEIRTSSRVDRVVEDGERVVGVVALEGDREITYRARGGVVFASGGFTHDRDLMLRFLRGPIMHGAAAPTNEGDFVRIASSIGARLGNMGNAWMAPIQLEQALEPSDALTNANITELWGDSAIVVNRYGVRVVNEKAMYHDFAHVFFEWDGRRGEYPNLRLFLIYDDDTAQIYGDDASGNPILPPDAEAAHIITAATLDELAAQLDDRLVRLGSHAAGVRLASDFAAQLAASIERFSHLARIGVDEDFHRGEKAIEKFFGGPARDGNEGNPAMHPFRSTGPYHAIILAPSTLDTKGGPVIDTAGRVLATDGEPIAGLYAAGNCVASPSGEGYWAGGATVGLAITFGRLAGLSAAASATTAGRRA